MLITFDLIVDSYLKYPVQTQLNRYSQFYNLKWMDERKENIALIETNRNKVWFGHFTDTLCYLSAYLISANSVGLFV